MANKPTPVTFPNYPRGIPGVPQYVISRPHFEDPNDPRNHGNLDGEPGEYEVIMTLARPGVPLVGENNHAASEYLRGDSYIAISAPALQSPTPMDRLDIIANSPHGYIEFEGIPNNAGYLATFRCSVQATTWTDAMLKAHRVLVPALGGFSAHLDIPIEIRQTDVIEKRTGTRYMKIVTTPAAVALAILPSSAPSDEFRAYTGLYREGVNSTSMRYRFLCFHKISDAIYARRKRLAGRRPLETLPNRDGREAWIKAIFPPPVEIDDFVLEETFPQECLEKKLGKVFQNYLVPLRNEIAHGVLNSGELVGPPDDPEQEKKIIRWLPLSKCVARRLLKNEFPNEFLSYLKEDGTVVDPTLQPAASSDPQNHQSSPSSPAPS